MRDKAELLLATFAAHEQTDRPTDRQTKTNTD